MATVSVLIDATRVGELDTAAKNTCGNAAKTLADAHGVAGGSFSFKVDGVEAAPSAPVTGIADGAVVELVEVPLAPSAPAAEEPVEDAAPADE